MESHNPQSVDAGDQGKVLRDLVTDARFLCESSQWTEGLLQRYYQAMAASLEVWLRWIHYPNPRDASLIVGEWFDREVGLSAPPEDSTSPMDLSTPADKTRRRFHTLLSYREKLLAQQSSAIASDRQSIVSAGMAQEADERIISVDSEDGNRFRRRFRDYLWLSLRNFASDWLKRENRYEGLHIDELPGSEGCDLLDHLTAQESSPPHVRMAAEICDAFDRFCNVLACFKETAQSHRRRGGGRLPTWWSLVEIRILRPLLLGLPRTSHAEIARSFGLTSVADAPEAAGDAEKTIRNAFANMWRSIRRHLPDDVSDLPDGMTLSNARFVDRLSELAGEMQAMNDRDRGEMEAVLVELLQPHLTRLRDLLDEPLEPEAGRFSLFHAVQVMPEIATEYTEEDCRQAWDNLLASTVMGPGLSSEVRIGALLSIADHGARGFETLKTFAKNRMKQADVGESEEVAYVLYHAALAAALVRCHTRIGNLLDAERRCAWKQASRTRWLDDSTRSLFEEALQRLPAERLSS